MTIEDTCDLIRLGLSAENVRVQEVNFLNNNTFIVIFIAKNEGSVDIKSEIGFVIGFLNGLLKNDFEVSSKIAYYAAKAINSNNTQLIYAISSLEAAEHISSGNTIGWLQGTIFDENTDDHRRQIAKKLVYEIENGLRQLICKILSNYSGTNWWDTHVGNRVRQETERMYERQEGIAITDGSILINYTFLLDLRKIIVSNWSNFKDILSQQATFTSQMEELNSIRRTEAHNRVLNDIELKKLKNIYSELMEHICKVVPEAADAYLTENWANRISDCFNDFAEKKITIPNGTPLPETITMFKQSVKLYQYLETKISGIVIPAGKQALHDDLVSHVKNVRKSMEKMLEHGEEINVDSLLESQHKNAKANKDFSTFTENFLLSIA